jgi:peroxiredoxin
LVQLRDIFPTLQELGADLIAISPDRPVYASESRSKHHLPFTLLSDSTMEGARAFGVAYRVDPPTLSALTNLGVNLEEASGEKHNLLPVPAVFLTDTNRVIQFYEYILIY